MDLLLYYASKKNCILWDENEDFDLPLLFMQMLVSCNHVSAPTGTIAFLLPGRRGVISCGRHRGSDETADGPRGSVFLLSPFRGERELPEPHSLGACLVFFFFFLTSMLKNSPLQLISFPVFAPLRPWRLGSSLTEFSTRFPSAASFQWKFHSPFWMTSLIDCPQQILHVHVHHMYLELQGFTDFIVISLLLEIPISQQFFLQNCSF